MKLLRYKILLILLFVLLNNISAQNPIIMDQYTADPTARVFDGKVYLYPSHDILATEGKGRIGWFCMEDYHVFSSENLTDWKDHGVIVSQNKVPWVDSNTYSMWAPDCIEKNGKYYFYFPAMNKDTSTQFRMNIGVAVSDKPYGPFTPQNEPIKNVRGIDPNVFIDKDGQAYLYWSARNIFVAKLKDNMLELAEEPIIIPNLPEKGLKEGPFMFERNGIYYLTYPHVENKTERLEYAIGDNPLGPFKVTGIIMDESPNCWTNHHSIIEFKNQWYLFYHFNDLSPHFDKNRSTRIDSLFFNEDGTIQKVIPTLRGVGLTNAKSKIQIDRYSLKSENNVHIEFIDTTKKFEGWKTVFENENSWIQYNSVEFGNENLKSIIVNAMSSEGGELEVRLGNINGKIIAKIEIEKSDDWKIFKSKIANVPTDNQNIVVINKGKKVVVDWISFE
ncbi:MAG: family 43 glycosylhydrolase [Ignavibacteriae bacterium]|nr:family 43 glycosylhydrolase [Ignavibacteriota bacterium]